MFYFYRLINSFFVAVLSKMPPHISKEEDLILVRNKKLNTSQTEDDLPPREYVLVWRNIALYIILHTSAIYGFYLMLFSGSWYTLIWGKFNLSICGINNLMYKRFFSDVIIQTRLYGSNCWSPQIMVPQSL